MKESNQLTPLKLPILFTDIFTRNLAHYRNDSDISDINCVTDAYKEWECIWFTNSIENNLFDFVEVSNSMKEFIKGCFV